VVMKSGKQKIISSTVKMEKISSSETSVVTQQTTRHHIPEGDTLQIVKGLCLIQVAQDGV
jgi:hypothetical protein